MQIKYSWLEFISTFPYRELSLLRQLITEKLAEKHLLEVLDFDELSTILKNK